MLICFSAQLDLELPKLHHENWSIQEKQLLMKRSVRWRATTHEKIYRADTMNCLVFLFLRLSDIRRGQMTVINHLNCFSSRAFIRIEVFEGGKLVIRPAAFRSFQSPVVLVNLVYHFNASKDSITNCPERVSSLLSSPHLGRIRMKFKRFDACLLMGEGDGLPIDARTSHVSEMKD